MAKPKAKTPAPTRRAPAQPSAAAALAAIPLPTAPMRMLDLASAAPEPVPTGARKLLAAVLPAPPREHVVHPAERIGATADGRPLYRAVDGHEPTTAYETSAGGNWAEARREYARAALAEGDDPLAERLGDFGTPAASN